jgi:dipeptidyl aminopeptidase
VDIFYLTKYGTASYPTQIPVKYPKAGYTNPTVELLVYNLASNVTGAVDFDFGQEYLIVQLAWIDNANVATRLTNRIQNMSQLYRVDTTSLAATAVSGQSSQTGWVEYVSAAVLIPRLPA